MRKVFRNKVWKCIFGLVAVVVIYALAMLGLIFSTYREVPPDNISVVIVLGARVKGDIPAQPTDVLKERLDAAYEYLVKNMNSIVVVTGGQGSNESEPEGVVMSRYLIDRGIDVSRIVVEDKSTTTMENIKFALELYPTKTAVIVSNDYHIYRAKRMARQAGIETVYGLAAPSTTIATFISYVRETVAVGYHLIFTR